MKKFFIVALIGVAMTVGLVLAGCLAMECPGNGNCTVTIKQGTSGLYIDSDSPRSSCGNSGSDKYRTCYVANVISAYHYEDMRYGTWNCNCSK